MVARWPRLLKELLNAGHVRLDAVDDEDAVRVVARCSCGGLKVMARVDADLVELDEAAAFAEVARMLERQLCHPRRVSA